MLGEGGDACEYNWELHVIPYDTALKAMDEFAMQEAIGFFKWNAKEIAKYLNYCKKVQEAVTDEEMERALTTFESSNIAARYQLYLKYKEQQ